MKNKRGIKIRVIGGVAPFVKNAKGYEVHGDGNAVCFYIDCQGNSEWKVVCSTVDVKTDCPIVSLVKKGTKKICDVEFTDLPGWEFFCASEAYRTIRMAFVKR